MFGIGVWGGPGGWGGVGEVRARRGRAGASAYCGRASWRGTAEAQQAWAHGRRSGAGERRMAADHYGVDIRQFLIKPRRKVVEEMKAQRRSAVAAVEEEMDSLLTRLDAPPHAKAPTAAPSNDESDDELVFKSPPPPVCDKDSAVQGRSRSLAQERPATFDGQAKVFEQTFEQELAVAEIGASTSQA